MSILTDQEILEKEIQKSSKRIEIRQKEIEITLDYLTTKINKYTNWAWCFVWFGLAVAALSIIFYLYKHTEQGFGLNLLGDFMAGTVASIWSLAGLFFIYIAFLGQKQQLLNQQLEIMYSQLELKYTRSELSRQRIEMSEQNKTLKQQKFENTFFQMLNLFNSIVNSLDIRNRNTKDVTTSGRDCFEVFYKRLKGFLPTIITNDGQDYQKISIDHMITAYDKFYTDNRADISHYFRTLYHIIKFIENSPIENKKQYISIVRAQLSSYEQIMIFYNFVHENGSEKFKPLIEKYSLFKNIDFSLLINEANHRLAYNNRAFGN